MTLLHCKAKTIWLLSICIGSRIESSQVGIFHFRGYLDGQWITKILAECGVGEAVNWQLGVTYLLKLQVLNIDPRGELRGFLQEVEELEGDLGKDWEF